MDGDLSFVDDELRRQNGVPPQILKMLGIGANATAQPAGQPAPVSLSRPKAATEDRVYKPGSMDYRLNVGATSHPNMPAARKIQAPEAPDISTRNPQVERDAGGLSFVNRQPTPPASNSSTPLSFAQEKPRGLGAQNSDAGLAEAGISIPVRSGTKDSSGTGGSLPLLSFLTQQRQGKPADTVAQSTPPASSIARGDSEQGVSPTSVPDTANAARLMRAAQSQSPRNENSVPTGHWENGVWHPDLKRPGSEQQPTDLASIERQYRDLQAHEPKQSDFPQASQSKLHKFLKTAARVAATAGIGATAGGPAAVEAWQSPVWNRPKEEAQKKFGDAHEKWGQNAERLIRAYRETEGRQAMRPVEDVYRRLVGHDVTPQSVQDSYTKLLAQEPTREQFKALIGGARATEDAERDFQQAHKEWQDRLGRVENLGKMVREKPENLDREAFDYYVGKGMSPADARKRVMQDAESAKTQRPTHTNPFEAFAYGDANEKKAAENFITLEHRLGRQYRTETEFHEKYRLFKEDPDTYRAMFGDKSGGGGPDKPTATRMLSYFDKRRKEVNQDFTLDEEQKKEQLAEIEKLEKPFMDAVQPGAGGRGGNSDRVEVVHPDGRRGTIPRSQLGAAKKKGYREAQPR
jgi:hypothetical protein